MPSVRTPLARMLPRVMGVGFCIETGYRVGCLIGPYNNYFRSIDSVILLIEARRTTPRFRPHPSTPRLGLQCGWPYGQMVDADRQISEPLRVSQKSCRGPRIIATDRRAPLIGPRMIPLCSRFDSVLFTPKMFRIASYGDYSRSPVANIRLAR